MLEILRELVQETPVKNLGRKVKSNSELYGWLMSETSEFDNVSVVQRVWMVLNHKPSRCENQQYPVFNSFTKGFRQYCGSKSVCECQNQQHSEIMKSHWAGLDPGEKQKRADASHMQTPEARQRAAETNLKKYGVDKPFKSKDIRNKASRSYREKTGYATPLQNPEVQAKGLKTTVERYGGLMSHARTALYQKYNGNPFAHPDVKKKIQQRAHPKQQHYTDQQKEMLREENFALICKGKSIVECAHQIGVNPTTISRTSVRYGLRDIFDSTRSQLEHKVKDLLDSLGVEYVQNDRTIIAPMEIDFYLPEYRVGIEVGSLFWHSEVNAGRSKNYHYDKWLQCKHNNIELYQWFDDDIRDSWPVIESKIRYVTKNIHTSIGARCVDIDFHPALADMRALLDENHIQGFTNHREYNVGAVHQNQLVGLMCFAKRKNHIELVRYVTKLGSTYPGLFSKLLGHSLSAIKYQGSVVSFSNNCHSNGGLYAANGFVQDKILPAAYWYTQNYHDRYNRQNFTKAKIQKRFNLSAHYVNSKTEWQLMQEQGYDRIWDAGKIRWVRNVSFQ